MSKFKMTVGCPVCDELIVDDGIVVDFTTPNTDIPIVSLGLFSQSTFKCEKCGTTVYIGDEDNMYEYEEGDV